jgi:hypothetical protein
MRDGRLPEMADGWAAPLQDEIKHNNMQVMGTIDGCDVG